MTGVQTCALPILWPGFGENSRVLKWIIDRVEGNVDGVESAIGLAPNPADLDVAGLDIPAADLEEVLTVRNEEWQAELPLIEEWFTKVGTKLPAALKEELAGLKDRLA